MESCLYEGTVYHERLQPVKHRFRYRLYMYYIDLGEVPMLLKAGLLSEHYYSMNGFLRRDHFGDPKQPLEDSVRELIRRETGLVVNGPIRMLTQLRNLGYYFSPLNLFFCYASDGSDPQAVVAEVQNTPWLERHCYILWTGNQLKNASHAEYRHPKSFHVSPFMNMDVDYHWRLSVPSEHLRIGITNTQAESPMFRASMLLHRVPLSNRSRRYMNWRYPLMTSRIMAAIYLQAIRLWRKKCPFYPHPKHHVEPSNPLTSSTKTVLVHSPDSAVAD